MSDLNRLQKFLDKEYRDSYLESHVKGSIAYQIQALREKEGLTQTEFGRLIGKPQPVVSRLEDTEYGGVSVNTLLEVAYALKVGLEIRFCDFERVLLTDVSPAGLGVESIDETIQRISVEASPAEDVLAVVVVPIEGRIPWPTTLSPSLKWSRGSGTPNFAKSTPIPAPPA